MSKNALRVGETLKRGDSLVSPDGTMKFIFEKDDGNFSLWQESFNPRKRLWMSKKDAQKGWTDKQLLANLTSTRYHKMWEEAVSVTMQDDGNLVQYSKDRSVPWASNTAGKGDLSSVLTVQDDDNAVVTSAGQVIWSTGTKKRE